MKLLSKAIIVTSMLVGSTAFAQAPQMTQFTLTTDTHPTEAPVFQTCEAAGETYNVSHFNAAGPIVSSDVRFNGGTFFVDATLVYQQDGTGLSWDEVKMVGVDGTVALGTAYALGTVFNPDGSQDIKAFVSAKVVEPGAQRTQVLWANSVVHIPSPPDIFAGVPITIKYGTETVAIPDQAQMAEGLQQCLSGLGVSFPN